MSRRAHACLCSLLSLATGLAAAGLETSGFGIEELPTFRAALSIGFNYDLLYPPTEVPFDYPRGYLGLNVPFEQNFRLLDIARAYQPAADSLFSSVDGGGAYQPRTSARQNPNTTIRVDVPMMGGTASFSNTQNFALGYENVLGNSNLFFMPESLQQGVGLLLRGTINVPMELGLAWESMTLGYAYRVNRYFVFAFNLHRHLFSFDLNGSVNADILGRLHYDAGAASGAAGNGVPAMVVDRELDYGSDRVNGSVSGHYTAEAWSPTIGLEAWRFNLTARFGLNTMADGKLDVRYSLPFFIDPQTFKMSMDLQSSENLLGNVNKLMAGATDSIRYFTESRMRWKMPTGVTLSFDLIPHKLNLSYSKLFGETSMWLPDIRTVRPFAGRGDSVIAVDTLDIGMSVDNVILLSGSWQYLYFNIGIFTIDFRTGARAHILGNAIASDFAWLKLAGAPMLPVLNAGSAIGTRMQLLVEIDVLPLPALRAGVRYYF